MSKVQVIEKDGKPAFYVVPADLWAQVKDILEDAEDAAAYAEAVIAGAGRRIARFATPPSTPTARAAQASG